MGHPKPLSNILLLKVYLFNFSLKMLHHCVEKDELSNMHTSTILQLALKRTLSSREVEACFDPFWGSFFRWPSCGPPPLFSWVILSNCQNWKILRSEPEKTQISYLWDLLRPSLYQIILRLRWKLDTHGTTHKPLLSWIFSVIRVLFNVKCNICLRVAHNRGVLLYRYTSFIQHHATSLSTP